MTSRRWTCYAVLIGWCVLTCDGSGSGVGVKCTCSMRPLMAINEIWIRSESPPSSSICSSHIIVAIYNSCCCKVWFSHVGQQRIFLLLLAAVIDRGTPVVPGIWRLKLHELDSKPNCLLQGQRSLRCLSSSSVLKLCFFECLHENENTQRLASAKNRETVYF